MIAPGKFIVGTSGYSFEDWVGPFYPPGTKDRSMFDHYARNFQTTELNFTFYSMPFPRTLESLARRSSEGFSFWLKAHGDITHKHNLSICDEFIEDLSPLRIHNKLAGVLLQFPQSFRRTIENRKFLASAIDAMKTVPLAVEFRHKTWDVPESYQGLRDRDVACVVPDEPDLPELYHPRPLATNATAYLRLHSRDAAKWYGSDKERYDYDYSEQELRDVLTDWSNQPFAVDRVYTFFNNCHAGHAAANAMAFKKILEGI